uniref:Acetyltransferase domain protein n=1 Tax=Rhizobium rhizogenes TaxID=359 RepID=A0A7S5DQJ4_RHIRH|nr:GNAT family protein [Rhizobium rhizogenes]QCL09173.1 acetyltransferase domain protein [Rhizobium rhizogenes]QCL09809.1 acetyltransferase domain protein [Rhizobium rhizogenes]
MWSEEIPVLTNGKLSLRPVNTDDVDPFLAIALDPEIWRYFISEISNRSDMETFVEDAIRDRKNGLRHAFSVETTDGRLIGSTALGNFSPRDGRIEIGWTWMGQAYQGTGANAAVKFLLMQYTFEKMNIARLEFKTDVLNSKARRALTKIGAQEEGVLRSHTLMPGGRRRDTIYYSILRDEWPSLRARQSLAQ